MAFDQNKYQAEWAKENYDKIYLKVPKGKRDELRALAKDNGMSMNRLFIEAVEDKYLISLTKDKD